MSMRRALFPLSCGLLSWGLLAAACGGGTGTEQPPEMAEQPPGTDMAPPPVAETPESPEAAPKPKVAITDAVKTYAAASDAAWAAKDVAKLKGLYAERAVIAMPGVKGMEESTVAEFDKRMPGYFTAFPDVKHHTTRAIVDGDVAITQWVVTGKNTGEFMGEKATNKPVGYEGASVLWFDDAGKVKRENVYFDMSTLMGQLGKGQKGQKVRKPVAAPTAAFEMIVAKPGDEKHEATLKNFYGLLEKKDEKGAFALLADDVVVSNVYMPNDLKGRHAVQADIKAGAKAFVDPKTQISQCVAAGDFAACEFTWTATWKGWAMGMAATGKTGTVHGLEIVRLKDGKIAQTHGYGSGLEFAASFGLLKEEKPAAPKGGAKQPPAPSASKGQGSGKGTGQGTGQGTGKGGHQSGATQPAKASGQPAQPSAPVKK